MRFSTSCGCCYCERCRIVFDDFNRADSTTVGGSWTEAAGDWLIASNELTTAATDAILYNDYVHPYGVASNVITVSVKGDDPGDQLDVLSGSNGTGDYIRARLTLQDGATCGTLSVDAIEGAAENNLGLIPVPGAVEDAWHKIKFCHWYSPALYMHSWTVEVTTSAGHVIQLSGTGGVNYSKVGLGTGTITTLAHFEDFCWQRHQVTETLSGFGPDPGCPYCRGSCQFSKDYFTGTGTDLGCAWEECTGNWEIEDTGGGVYAFTITTAPAELLHTIVHPQGIGNELIAEGYIKLEDAGDIVRVRLGPGTLCGQSDGFAVEIEAGASCGVMRLFDDLVQVGTDAPIYGLVPDVWHHLRVCSGYGVGLSGSIFTSGAATITTASGTVVRYSSDIVASTGVMSFETDTITTKAWFRGWTLSKGYDARDAPDCEPCSSDDTWCAWGLLTCGDYDTCAWYSEAGTWTCGATSSSNAIKRYELEQPHRSPRMRMTGTVAATGEAVAIARIAYENSTTNLALAFYFDDATCPKVALLEDGVAIRTVLDHRIVSGIDIDFCVQYDGTEISAWYRLGSTVYFDPDVNISSEIYLEAPATASAAGLKAALSTGTVAAGTVTFTDVTLYVSNNPYNLNCDDCDECTLWSELFVEGADGDPLPCSYGGTAVYGTYSAVDGGNGRCAVIPAGGSLTFNVGTLDEDVGCYINFALKTDNALNSLRITACGVVATVAGQGDSTADIDIGGGTPETLLMSERAAYVAKLCAFTGAGDSRLIIAGGRNIDTTLSVTGNTYFAHVDGTGTVSGSEIKLEALSDDIYIHSVVATRHYRNDTDRLCNVCRPYCGACEDGIAPLQVLVEIDGCTPDISEDECCAIEGSYFVDMTDCTGTLVQDGRTIFVEFLDFDTYSVVRVTASYAGSGYSPYGQWTAVFSKPFDCTAIPRTLMELAETLDPFEDCYNEVAGMTAHITVS